MAAASLRPAYLVAAAVIIGAGLLVRWPALGLPWPVAKYAGSVLWGALVYAVLRLINPGTRPVTAMAVAALIAASVEVSRLYHVPWLDEFRATLAGQLLLGRIFSALNIVAYWAGIGLAAWCDHHWRRPS